MASSLISNSHHVDFDSVFGMDDATITNMFELLIATGLKDFLGCPAVYYEAALIEFFENGSVREDGMVVSTIRGINVDISEGMFATEFGLPTEGLTDMSDVPKDLVFDARSLFSESEEQGNDFWKSSCRLSLFVNKRQVPASVVKEDFVPHGCLIEPFQYWGAAPYLIKTWGWARVCTEVIRYGMFGCLRPVREDICRDIVVSNLGVERIPAGFRRIFRQGMDSNSFVNSFVQLDSLDIQSIQEFESASSDGSTIYRSPSPILKKDDSFDQENLYFVESPESPPRPLLSQDSTSSSSDSQMNFDDTDTSAPAPTISQPGFSTVSPDITEVIHQLRTSLDQISNQDNGAALKDVILLHLHDIEKKFTTRFDAQDRWFGTLRKYSNDQINHLSLEIKSSQRQINTQIAAATLDQIDMQREVKELNAKVDAMATNLEILRRNAEATTEAISHQLLEFQAKIAADILSLSIQIGELVDHIRGGDAKKGEIGSSSRRPLHTPVNQGESSSGHGRVLSVEEAAEMVREADRQADRREREREREKRLRRLRRRGH
ncbi:hypothetical protein F511_26871 [Dorcoceras hygrometricum]|uniref:Dystroglycan-like n=1 Tax=Dorcoceras hygrometricum TaxID=472368 RepID=A0A2Z7D4B1_9LAMI|nr:hypothetical protein F511_26871 [Dorcoceras hygrometricum]